MTRISSTILIASVTLLALFVFFIRFQSLVSPSYQEIYTTDYPNYYYAGKRWIDNEEIYSSIKEEVEKDFGWAKYAAYTADTPLTVILFSPLSKLSIADGAFLLNVISTVLVAWSVFLIANVSGIKISQTLMLVALALSSMPFLILLKKFHMESIILFLVTAGFVCLKKDKLSTAGALWGICGAIKLFPLLLIVPYLFRREKRKLFISGLLTFIALTLLSFLFVGGSNTYTFLFEVTQKSKLWFGTVGNYSLISFFTALLSAEHAYLPALLSCLFVFLTFLHKIREGSPSDERLLTLAISAALLISPLSWLNYYILTFPFLIFLYTKSIASEVKSKMYLVLLFIILCYWPDYIGTPFQPLTIVLSFLPMFALLSVLFIFEKRL